ncbi:aldehyde reductase II [Fusarium coicis]|nr:aldehyde reductase II [Fusarium coicis]
MPNLSPQHIAGLDLALLPGSLIVVTGANGFIGSHICDQLLGIGYQVRGTVRSLERSHWLRDYFENKYRSPKFQLVVVPDIDKEGAFDEAVADRNPSNVVPKMIAATLNLAKSASKSSSVKRLVLTLSIAAVADPKPGVIETLTTETYNEEAVAIVDSGTIPQGFIGGHTVYAAAKTKSEKAFWEYYAERMPDIVLQVLPSPCFGKVLSVEDQGFGSANAVLKLLFDGDTSCNILDMLLAQWYVDVVDVSVLLIGALLLSEVKGERIFGSAGRYTVNDLLHIFRSLYPDRGIANDLPNIQHDLRKLPSERSAQMLKLMGM